MVRDGCSCPGCGLANYDGLCPHCRGDQDAYERELVPPFDTSIDAAVCGWCDYGIPPCTCGEAE